MLSLNGYALALENFPLADDGAVMRLCSQQDHPTALQEREAFLVQNDKIPHGFNTYVLIGPTKDFRSRIPAGAKTVVLPIEFNYLADGDVFRVWPAKNQVRVLYRRNSPHNHFLTTERCNHYCLMCSQPPKDVDDSWIVKEILDTIPLIDPSTRELGFTGGEPTLLGDDFFRILRAAKTHLPTTAIHVLSNGRLFADAEFAKGYAEIEHPDIMLGIPLYSDVATIHDYVVQSSNAFDETIRGILNLKERNQRVEIRIVIHRQTYQRLPQLAEFIARNLTFVDHVALMGLEMMGFTRANLDTLWIDPVDYQSELKRAISLLADYRIKASIYNHQLCVLDRELWPFARKSISDWKNEYMPECELCTEQERCGGFFSSARLRYSSHIRPIRAQHLT